MSWRVDSNFIAVTPVREPSRQPQLRHHAVPVGNEWYPVAGAGSRNDQMFTQQRRELRFEGTSTQSWIGHHRMRFHGLNKKREAYAKHNLLPCDLVHMAITER